jgi:hypothetical protein
MDKSYLLFHTSYIDRALQFLQGRVDYVSNIFKEVILQFQRHCGAIRRKANARVEAAQEKLKAELEKSCQGLIIGYTGGYAQGFFDELLFKGELLRQTITDMHGVLILEKEKLVCVYKGRVGKRFNVSSGG